MATSHAFSFMEPEEWDSFRERNRASYKRRRGIEAPVHTKIAEETIERDRKRFDRIRGAHRALRDQLIAAKPDAIILIGDDQNEVFVNGTTPQIAIYRGGDFTLSPRFSSGDTRYRSCPWLAESLLDGGITEGFDIALLDSFENDVLSSHAHAQVLEALVPEADIPVVPLYVNAIHHPALEPQRCYELGKSIRRVISSRPQSEKVAVCASGGLSHFTAGYPWDRYQGPYFYGAISEAFDREIIDAIKRGDGDRLAKLSAAELMANGDIELRTWIVLLGIIGNTAPQLTVYEPFYRAIMGMAVVSWPAIPA
tara:strand:- start:18220 stop:19149 length:930 start_codon:yes stop_codon:yes gene_type:complete